MIEKETNTSGHEILEIMLETKIRIARRVRKLKQAPDWRKSEQVEPATWRQILAEILEQIQGNGSRERERRTMLRRGRGTSRRGVDEVQQGTRGSTPKELLENSTRGEGSRQRGAREKIQREGRSKGKDRRSRALLNNPEGVRAQGQREHAKEEDAKLDR